MLENKSVKEIISLFKTKKASIKEVVIFYLERINLNADLSSKGLNQSKGVMVNYLYNLETLEENHELFFKTKEVKQSDAIKSLRKKLQIQ